VHALQVIGAPRRQQILRLVWDRELAAGDIHRRLGDLSFAAVSQHLRVLGDAGLVEARRDGRRRLYRAVPDRLGPLRTWLEQMWGEALWQLKIRAEVEQARRGPRTRSRRTER